MTTYRITNTTSGHCLGDFEGETALAAYWSMMADAGYATEADALSAGLPVDGPPDDIRIQETCGCTDDDLCDRHAAESDNVCDACGKRLEAFRDADGAETWACPICHAALFAEAAALWCIICQTNRATDVGGMCPPCAANNTEPCHACGRPLRSNQARYDDRIDRFYCADCATLFTPVTA